MGWSVVTHVAMAENTQWAERCSIKNRPSICTRPDLIAQEEISLMIQKF